MEEETKPKPVSVHELPDFYLESLKVVLNSSESVEPGNSIGMTLHIAGSVIAGNMVSEKKWISELRRSISSDDKNDGAPFVLSALSAVEESGSNISPGSAAFRALAKYVHLIDAHSLSGGNLTYLGAVRIKQESINAWSVGRLTQ